MAGGANGIRAGRAYVELGVHDRMQSALNAAAARLKTFGASIQSVGLKTMGVGAAITTPFVAMAKSAASSGAEIFDMSKRTGMSAESLSVLKYAAKQTGADLGVVEQSIKRMQKTVAGVADEAEGTTGSLEHLGLVNEKIAAMSADQQFYTISRAIAGISDPTQRAAAAMKVFGRSGTAMIPIGEGLEKFSANAKRLNLIKTGQSVAQAKAMEDAFTDLQMSLSSLKNKIGSSLFPMLKQVVEYFTAAIVTAGKWVSENKGMIVLAMQIGTAFTVAGAAMVVLGRAAILAGTSLKVISATFGLLLNPITLVVGAVAGLGYYLATQTAAGQQAVASLSDTFSDLASTATTAWGGITAAISSGDLALAAQIAWTGLKLAAYQCLTAILQKVNEWGPSVVGYFWNPIMAVVGAFYSLKKYWADAVGGMRVIWVSLGAWLETTWNNIVNVGQKIWNKFAETFPGLAVGIENIWKNLMLFLNSLWENATGGMRKGISWIAEKLGVISEEERAMIDRQTDTDVNAAIVQSSQKYSLSAQDKYKNGFNADAENAKLDSVTQAKNAEVEKARDAELSSISNETDAKIAALENDKNNAIQRLADIRSGKDGIFGSDTIAALESNIENYKKELGELTTKAKDQAKSTARDELAGAKPPATSLVPQGAAERMAAAGRFTAITGREFTVNIGVNKLEKYSQQTADHTKRIYEKIDKGTLAFT